MLKFIFGVLHGDMLLNDIISPLYIKLPLELKKYSFKHVNN